MFTKATEYALRASIFIAANSSEDKRLGIDEISAAIGSPKPFTAKVLQNLCRNNSPVSSVKGPGGGFYMTAKAKKVSARKIIDAMGESAVLSKCVLGLPRCSEEKPCPMHHEYRFIKARLLHLFESTTIEELATDSRLTKIYLKGNAG